MEKVHGNSTAKENFDCGNPNYAQELDQWPSQEILPGFRTTVQDFYQVSVRTPVLLPDLVGLHHAECRCPHS